MTFLLETERLLLRPKTLDDLEPLARVFGDPEVTAWLWVSPPTRDELRERLVRSADQQNRYGFSIWAMIEKASGEFVGHAGLHHLEDGPEIEVGWTVARDRWGRGYATEAGSASLAFGFDELGLAEIVAVTRPDNVASRRVMEKLGMERVGRCFCYGWQQVKYVVHRPT